MLHNWRTDVSIKFDRVFCLSFNELCYKYRNSIIGGIYMARSPLEEKLKENGCETPIGGFQDILEAVLQDKYSTFSVDSLMQHPSEALAYCETIRGYRKDFETLPEDLILRSLMARRKNPV